MEWNGIGCGMEWDVELNGMEWDVEMDRQTESDDILDDAIASIAVSQRIVLCSACHICFFADPISDCGHLVCLHDQTKSCCASDRTEIQHR